MGHENDKYISLYFDGVPFKENESSKPRIKDVIFNPPATIILWTDGTKTVVKTQNEEEFDPEKGLAMAMVKKLYGNNKGHYFETIKKWTGVYRVSRIFDMLNRIFEEGFRHLSTPKKE